MSCTNPLQAYESPFVWPSGKTKLTFNPAKSVDGKVMPIPCGSCLSCRLDKAREWGFRIEKEASLYELGFNNSFVTLTYDDENLPRDLSLVKSHFQKFIRATRQKYKRQSKDNPIRYFMCGEYGEATQKNGGIARPHYHALLLNFRFPDETKHYIDSNGSQIYASEDATALWDRGLVHIGNVNQQSASYVARYSLKKQTEIEARKIDPDTGLRHYETQHLDTGETVNILPEYVQMSTNPGIGKDWFDKYKKDMYPAGTIYVGHSNGFLGKGRPTPIFLKTPRYFDKLLEKERPDMLEYVKENRVEFAKENAHNTTDDRLAAKALIVSHNAKSLIRKL